MLFFTSKAWYCGLYEHVYNSNTLNTMISSIMYTLVIFPNKGNSSSFPTTTTQGFLYVVPQTFTHFDLDDIIKINYIIQRAQLRVITYALGISYINYILVRMRVFITNWKSTWHCNYVT